MRNIGNHTPLEVNVLDSLETEEAQKAFLWACDKDKSRFKYKAEKFAREVDYLAPVLRSLINLSAMVFIQQKPELEVNAGVCDDLYNFMITRHCNHYFPQSGSGWL